MKRDLSLFRQILADCEDSDDDYFVRGMHWPGKFGSELDTKWNERELYHLSLMRDAGLIVFSELYDEDDLGFVGATKFRITNSGHDFLDAVRDEGIWKQTKKAVAETGGNVSLEVAKSLAAGFLKKKLSQHTGVDL